MVFILYITNLTPKHNITAAKHNIATLTEKERNKEVNEALSLKTVTELRKEVQIMEYSYNVII